MSRMTPRYKDRIREFRDEIRKELRSLLIQLREDIVSAFPEVDDGGVMASDLGNPNDSNDWLSLRRFDELAEGAEVLLQRGEWSSGTIYSLPPGQRDPFNEDPAPESRMLEILQVRYNRLVSKEKLNQLPRPIPVQIDHDKVRIEQIHADIRLRLVEWKQRSPEFSAFQIRIFVEALNPAGKMDVGGDFTLRSLGSLRMHLAGFPGVHTSIGYLDLISRPEALQQADNTFQSEVPIVVDALKQHLRTMKTGLQDEIEATSHPSKAIAQVLDRVVKWGGRNIGRDDG